MFCQTCGAQNTDEREFCLQCSSKLLVVSGPLGVEPEEEVEEGSLEEHLLERISLLEEVVRRSAESIRALLEYLYRTERSAAVSEAGVLALSELLSTHGVLAEEEITELWDRKTDERAESLEIRERFADRRDQVLAGFTGAEPRLPMFEQLVAEADFHFAAGDPEKGLSALEEAVGSDPSNVDLRLFLGETYFNLGELGRAAPHLDVVVEKDAERFDALVYRGAIAAEGGEPELAVELFERAIEVEPGSPWPRFALGVFFSLHKEWERALPHLEDALIRGETVQTHFFLGQVKLELGVSTRAIEHFKKVLSLDPRHEDALYHLGLCYLDRRWTRRAHACFERALALNPTRIDYQQASEILRTGSTAQVLGRDAMTLYREAEKQASAGNPIEAHALIRGARIKEPENALLAVIHALFSSSLGRTSEAIGAARETLRMAPPEVVSTGAYVALIESLRKEGRHEEAVSSADEMSEACQSQFARAIAHYERAMAMADSGDEAQGQRALLSATEALKQAPRELRHLPLEALGWAYYRRKEYESAIKYLERAVAALPNRSTLTHLGTALLAAGKADKAREVLQRARRESHGQVRIEDRMRELLHRQVRLDLSASHGMRQVSEVDGRRRRRRKSEP